MGAWQANPSAPSNANGTWTAGPSLLTLNPRMASWCRLVTAADIAAGNVALGSGTAHVLSTYRNATGIKASATGGNDLTATHTTPAVAHAAGFATTLLTMLASGNPITDPAGPTPRSNLSSGVILKTYDSAVPADVITTATYTVPSSGGMAILSIVLTPATELLATYVSTAGSVGATGTTGPVGPPSFNFQYSGPLPTSKIGTSRIYNDTGRTLTISAVRVSLGIAGSTSTIVDVNKGGTTIFTTQANRPTLAVAGVTAKSVAPDVTAWADGEYLTVDIDQGGTGSAGLQVQVVAA